MASSTPSWVRPSAQQLSDCVSLTRASGDPYTIGVAQALAWVTGAASSPISGDHAVPSPEAVKREFFAAGSVELNGSPISAVMPAATAQGVGRTLAWLLGWEPRPPIELPRRPVPTAEQLYAEAVATEPWRYDLPEEQAAGRLAAQAESARLARLAAVADRL